MNPLFPSHFKIFPLAIFKPFLMHSHWFCPYFFPSNQGIAQHWANTTPDNICACDLIKEQDEVCSVTGTICHENCWLLSHHIPTLHLLLSCSKPLHHPRSDAGRASLKLCGLTWVTLFKYWLSAVFLLRKALLGCSWTLTFPPGVRTAIWRASSANDDTLVL